MFFHGIFNEKYFDAVAAVDRVLDHFGDLDDILLDGAPKYKKHEKASKLIQNRCQNVFRIIVLTLVEHI
jgi:hypothetical protein